jgi:hypothetical protein
MKCAPVTLLSLNRAASGALKETLAEHTQASSLLIIGIHSIPSWQILLLLLLDMCVSVGLPNSIRVTVIEFDAMGADVGGADAFRGEV